MSPIKPPSAEEIEKALAASHSAVAPQAAPVPPNPIPIKPQANAEIEQALGEFISIESSPVQAVAAENEGSKIVNMVMKSSGGTISDRRQAEYLILGIVVLMILASLYLMFGRSRGEVDDRALQNMLIIHPDLNKR